MNTHPEHQQDIEELIYKRGLNFPSSDDIKSLKALQDKYSMNQSKKE